MKYIIPIKEYEQIINRGKEIASRKPTTPKEQYYADKHIRQLSSNKSDPDVKK